MSDMLVAPLIVVPVSLAPNKMFSSPGCGLFPGRKVIVASAFDPNAIPRASAAIAVTRFDLLVILVSRVLAAQPDRAHYPTSNADTTVKLHIQLD
jgi:hypothetical protein